MLDAAGVDRATVVGSSMGGANAIDLAIVHPGRVSALVAVGIGPRGRTPDAGLRAGWDAVGAAYEAGDIERAIDLDTEMWVQDPAIVAQVRAWNAEIFARDESDEHELDARSARRSTGWTRSSARCWPWSATATSRSWSRAPARWPTVSRAAGSP